MAEQIRKRVAFSGRVQGVGFRATVLSCIESVPVGRRPTGWVRNEPGGNVTLEIQGEPAGVEQALSTLRARMASNIDTDHVSDLPPDPREEGFAIRV